MSNQLQQDQQQQQAHAVLTLLPSLVPSTSAITSENASRDELRNIMSNSTKHDHELKNQQQHQANVQTMLPSSWLPTTAIPNPKHTSNNPKLATGITIDMISVGSIARSKYQMQQERTFATHKSIRQFICVNEYNDTSDSQCSQTLSIQQINNIKQFCNH